MSIAPLSNHTASIAWPVLGALGVCKLLVHFCTSGAYGYHGDELYFIACAQRLDFGYVDHPPVVPLLARASAWIFGGYGLLALRFFPSVAGALTVIVTGLMTRELGGDRFAQALAALAVLIAPVYLVFCTFLNIPGIELFVWTLLFYALTVLLKREAPRIWPLVGLIAGIGLLTKHTMLLLGFAVIIGLLATPARKHLANRWCWIGLACSLAAFVPNLLWQSRHGWPTVEFIRNRNLAAVGEVSPIEFLASQLLYLHPLGAPIWLTGLWYLLFCKEARRFRLFGWAFGVVLATLVTVGGYSYYLAPAYPILLAVGAVAIERFYRADRLCVLKPITLGVVLVGGVACMPISLSLLPINAKQRYVARATFGLLSEPQNPVMINSHLMFGWEDVASVVANVYRDLAPEQKAQCSILAASYEEAGAIDFFGQVYGLPGAVSGDKSYYLWGPGHKRGEMVIAVGLTPTDLNPIWGSVELVATIRNAKAIGWMHNRPVHLCKDPKMTLPDAWPLLKKF